MLDKLNEDTIKQIRNTINSPQIIIQLLEQDEPHTVGKLLNCNIVELYLLCEKLTVDAC